jgi:hypothetical protein
MSQIAVEQSTGQRFLVNLPVHAEWDEETSGKHVVVSGTTENIGPTGAMVTFERLPAVGSRIRISVEGARGAHFETEAEVVRLVRDLQRPLASLSVLKAQEEWRGTIWEQAKVQAAESSEEDGDDSEGSYAN